MAGLFYEDLEIGEQPIDATPYELTQEEIMSFSAKWDPWEFHTDNTAAEQSLFAGLAASGVHTVCIANLLMHLAGRWEIQALLGSEYRLPNPAREGDQLQLRRSITDKRESRSRPDAGIVMSQELLVNQSGNVVFESKTTVLVTKRPPA